MLVNEKHLTTIWYDKAKEVVKIIDQRLLPFELKIVELKTLEDFCFAIKEMQVRGAPLIGVTAAYGMYAASKTTNNFSELEKAGYSLKSTRPTAVNLSWAVDKIITEIKDMEKSNLQEIILSIANEIRDQDIINCKAIGENGSKLIENIYKKREEEFKVSSKESIEKIIDPLRELMKEYETEIRKNSEQQIKIHAQTKTTIDGLIEQTNQITSDTTNLANALRGDSKTQGDYGEMTLKLLFDKSGLEEDLHYVLQENYKVSDGEGLKDQRPDAIVYLPHERHLVIDSKFSFRAYYDYCSVGDEKERDKFGKLHSQRVKERIKELSEKKYSDIKELKTPGMTFLFIGIDDALNIALKYDNSLLSFATKKNIALLSPTQLHMALHMFENLWRIDKQSEQAFKIYEEARKLVEKLAGFVDSMDSLGNTIALSQKKFADAKNKLVDGTRSISSRINKLISLGEKETKKIKNDD